MDQKTKKILKIVLAVVIVAVLAVLVVKGVIGIGPDGKISITNNAVQSPVNTANTAQSNTSNTAPSNTSNPVPANTSNTSQGGTNISQGSGVNNNTTEPGGSATSNTAETKDGAKYTKDDLKDLTGTEIFNTTAIEHIFLGSVNSKKKGSGYHYDMIEDSPGKIVAGTRSEEDPNGIYTANVEVSGYKKSGYSSFFPDSWSPQEVVDAIAEARQEALKTGEMRGNYHVGHSRGIRIELYMDSKNKVVTAFPVYNGE